MQHIERGLELEACHSQSMLRKNGRCTCSLVQYLFLEGDPVTMTGFVNHKPPNLGYFTQSVILVVSWILGLCQYPTCSCEPCVTQV